MEIDRRNKKELATHIHLSLYFFHFMLTSARVGQSLVFLFPFVLVAKPIPLDMDERPCRVM